MRVDGVSALIPSGEDRSANAVWCGRGRGPGWLARYRLGSALPDLGPGFFAAPPRPVSVWLVAPAPAHATSERWMSGEEKARLATMQHPRARAEFLTGRWLLRGLLGSALGCPPSDVPLEETPEGALRLPGGVPVFNLSHTEGRVALAIAPHGELGVDVEWTARPGRTVELAERYFAVAEREALLALPEVAHPQGAPHQRGRFFELWTLKEAYIKARGLGLRIPLHSFAFDLEGAEPAITTSPTAGDGGEGWRFAQCHDGDRHALAVAWRPVRAR